MSGTNNSAATPPSYFDKAKDAVHSVVGNLTGTHDDKETVSKPHMPKVSSACAPAMDTECAVGKTAAKAMKDTDGSISMPNTVEEAIDMAGAFKSKAVEGAIDMAGTFKSKADEASKKVSLEGSKACSMVVENVNKAEATKDTEKPLNDAKLMDGACDTKTEKKMEGACDARSEKKMDDIHENKVCKSEKKMDGGEKPAEKMDQKMHHKKMDDKMNDKMDDKMNDKMDEEMDHKMDNKMGHKMDHKMDHKNTDQKMMDEEKMGKTCVGKQVIGPHMQKMDEVCEMGACVKNEEPKPHGYAATEKASHATGEMCSKKGSAGNTEF